MTDVIVGIDLGTTNSEIAVYQEGRPLVLADERGRVVLPSVVGLSETGELLVGEEARNQFMLHPERTVRSIKRRMGTDARVRLGERDYAPQEVSAMILSRQPMPTLDRTVFKPAAGVQKGAYVLADPKDGQAPQVILMGTGSELYLCVQAYEALAKEGIPARVVSMPCWEQFELQDQAYQDEVLPPAVRARVSVEAGVPMGWREFVGDAGRIVGIDHFGASAAYTVLYEEFGLTADAVVAAARESLEAASAGAPPAAGADTVGTLTRPTGDR